jgi:hypothetical protein
MNYQIIVSEQTFKKAEQYLKDLQSGSPAGFYLTQKLLVNINTISTNQLLELLLNTKQPQIFAESSIKGDGSDWNLTELSILGDISIAVDVKIFDNGAHSHPIIHKSPIDGTLVFTPGALLRCDFGFTPADWNEVTLKNNLNDEGFFSLYQRRLLPVFQFIDQILLSNNQKGIITIPGLGCGQFAGKFIGQLGTKLESALIRIIEEYGNQFTNINVIYFDPYNESTNKRFKINDINILVRPLLQGNQDKSQLSHPTALEEPEDDFSELKLFSIVAWDHVSWPGNDFYIDSRSTDDGVKAAATNSMEVITGIKGEYDNYFNKFLPPANYKNWFDIVITNDVKLILKSNLRVF